MTLEEIGDKFGLTRERIHDQRKKQSEIKDRFS